MTDEMGSIEGGRTSRSDSDASEAQEAQRADPGREARGGAECRPPSAPRRPRVDEIHGEAIRDDYFWLREKRDPAVQAYLRAENAYAETVMRWSVSLQERLYGEMVGHIKETDQSAPFSDRGYWHYRRTEAGKQYPIYCRRRRGLEAPEEVTLDLNELGRGLPFIALGAYDINDEGRLLAFSLDTTGFRQYTLQIKDLAGGERLPVTIEKTGTLAWAADGTTLFYTLEDAAKRQYRLYRHRLGTAGHDLIYEEEDERFSLYIRRTRSRALLLLEIASHTASEVRFLPAGEPEAEWRIVAPREPEHEYEVDHHGDRLYIRTNCEGRNFSLMTAPLSDPGRRGWSEIVPHRSEVMLDGIELFARQCVLLERENGLPQIRVMPIGGGESYRLEFPEPAYSVGPAENAEFDTDVFRFAYQSLVTPPSFYDHRMDDGSRILVKQTEVPGYDPGQYTTERVFATAPDGVKIPISLAYRKGTKRDGRSPLHLLGYGSYGYSLPVAFSSNRISLFDRGVAIALAHVRGGGEMGKRWHDEGRMMKKRNTFTDFIAAADHLVAEGYASRDRLGIEGASAGGLLVGAVLNTRPDLCRAALLKVPFVDVIHTMMDDSLPLTVGEYEEWGNPHIRTEYDTIRSYCPYTNLSPGAYPAMLVKTSYNDSQVMYWEPAKYVARLRTLKQDGRPLLLQSNMSAGHGGASGRYDALRETALDYAFLLWQLGVEP